MIKLITIETFKLFKRKKTWVVLIAFMMLTAVIAYGLNNEMESMRNYDNPKSKIANLQQNIELEEKSKEVIPEGIKDDAQKVEEYKKNVEQNIQRMKTEVAVLKASIDSTKDWREGTKERIKALEQEQKNLENAPYKVEPSQKDSLAQDIQKLQYLLDNNIEPEVPYTFNGFKFILELISMLGSIFLAIGIAVFAADMVSGEATPPTMKLLLTQPVSRAKVLLSKFLSINAASIVLILGVELLAFLLIGLFFGFGDANYPMLTGTKYHFDTTQLMENGGHPIAAIAGSTYIIPMWQYLIKALLLQALFIITCVSVVFLMSTLVKNSMVSMAISTVSIVATIVVFIGFGALRKFGQYIFLMFGDAHGVLGGQGVQMFRNPSLTAGTVCIMFGVWIIVSYIISHIVFTKKDILI